MESFKTMSNFKEMENQIVVLRNADEEIAKSEERNRMQMEDLQKKWRVRRKILMNFFNPWKPCTGMRQNAKNKRKKKRS